MMKQTISLILAALLIAGGVWYGVKKDRSPSSPVVDDTTADWKTYRNEEYGFELTLPDSWRGYKTIVHKYGSSGNYYADVCFGFSEPHPPFCVMQAGIFTQEQWDKFGEEYPEVGKPQYRNNRFIFSFGVTSSTSPGEIPCPQFDEFQCARAKEIPKILESFRTLDL